MKFENFEILLLLLRFPLFAPVGIDFAGRRGKGNGRKPKEKKKKEATEWNGGRFLLCAATEKLFFAPATGPSRRSRNGYLSIIYFPSAWMLASVLMDSTFSGIFFFENILEEIFSSAKSADGPTLRASVSANFRILNFGPVGLCSS